MEVIFNHQDSYLFVTSPTGAPNVGFAFNAFVLEWLLIVDYTFGRLNVLRVDFLLRQIGDFFFRFSSVFIRIVQDLPRALTQS